MLNNGIIISQVKQVAFQLPCTVMVR